MNHPKSKFGRRYDEDFKRQTVALIQSQQRSLRQLSRELGVSEWSLSRWCKQYANPAAAPRPPPSPSWRPRSPACAGSWSSSAVSGTC
jgi:transposase-like protein